MHGFRLLETIRVMKGGELYLLDRHMERLAASARAFGFACDVAAIRKLAAARAAGHGEEARMRLLLSEDGTVEVQLSEFPRQLPKSLRIATGRVRSSEPLLQHKTTNREVYGEAEALLVNERAEVTETAIANVAVLRDRIWVTPPVSCGLLPGVMRAELLERGEIVEGVIRVVELQDGETIRCFNSLRGVFDVPLEL
jgi:branched-subunit amino acid aminotransferase/4-amino-4-deoxychorismate lyase